MKIEKTSKKAKNNSSITIFLHEEILNDNDLSPIDMLLFGVIAFRASGTRKKCFASNANLANVTHCSVSTISKSIHKLKERKYITESMPDEEHGGRCYIRDVRKDLKSFEAAMKISDGRPAKLKEVPTEKSILKYKDKSKEESKYKILKKEEESHYVKENLSFENATELYFGAKKSYLKDHSLLWNFECVIELMNICDKIIKTFGHLDIKESDKLTFFLEVFSIVSSSNAKFINDRKLSSLNNLFKDITLEKKAHERIERLKSRYDLDCDSSF